MAQFVRHRITAPAGESGNSYDFWFLAPQGAYQGIGASCGVAEITSDTDVGNQMPITKVEELLKSVIAVRRKLRVDAGGGRTKYKDVVVATNKAAGFETDVVGKTTNLGTVTGVVEPLSATFR